MGFEGKFTTSGLWKNSHLWGQICRIDRHPEGEAGEFVHVSVDHGHGKEWHRYIHRFLLKMHLVPHRLCQIEDTKDKKKMRKNRHFIK